MVMMSKCSEASEQSLSLASNLHASLHTLAYAAPLARTRARHMCTSAAGAMTLPTLLH